MQVNKKIEEVCNKEFFYESYFIIKNNLIDEMFKYGYETNVRCNSKKILIKVLNGKNGFDDIRDAANK